MNKKSIIMILLTMIISISIISLYSTFAYDEEATQLNDSTADYNLIYSIKEKTKQEINVLSKDTKYVDITVNNQYSSNIKYGMYYYLISPKKMPNDVFITTAEESASSIQGIIKPSDSKTISIKIINNSEYNIDLYIGALAGFENGNLDDLITNDIVLIK